MFSNSAGSASRPFAVSENTSAWPLSTGGCPILPGANWAFCSLITPISSLTVTPSCVMRSGLSQIRMA